MPISKALRRRKILQDYSLMRMLWL